MREPRAAFFRESLVTESRICEESKPFEHGTVAEFLCMMN
jgi:hypothetical protein